MDDKTRPDFSDIRQKINRYEIIIEVSTWIVIIAVLFGIRFLPNPRVDDEKAYLMIGGIISFGLLYYFVIYKYFSRQKRLYLKDIADIVLIGILIHLLKDWGQYFFALYFLPIAAAALSLQFINALLIATVACLFVVLEVFLGAQGLMATQTGGVYQGIWQIGLILLITIFCRFLAVQLRQEKTAKEESIAYQNVLKEESKRQREFLSMTSHQLFTPLSMIRGFASMLHFGTLGEMTLKQREAVGEIYASSKRMINLVSELLTVSRIESGKIALKIDKYNLADILDECVTQFKTGLPKREVTLEFIRPKTVESVSLDKEKIRQVIYNLLDNAIKYTKKGQIKVTLKQDEAQTIVAIKDNGVGLEKEDFEKLFQPFFRGKTILELDNKGTGLGLYITKLIIDEHKGKVWATSEGKNKGTTFYFSLPMVKLEGKEQT